MDPIFENADYPNATKSKNERLKWFHVRITNIKANIEGAVYHGLGKTYLQRYLVESCYRLTMARKACVRSFAGM